MGERNEDADPADNDGESDLDDNVGLESPLLNAMLSDRQPAQNPGNTTASTAIVTHTGTTNCEPTEDDWENM